MASVESKDIELKIRVPSGSTLSCSFPADATLSDLNAWIAEQIGEKNLLLSLSYPRKIYELDEQAKTTLSQLPGFNSGKGLLIAQRSISTTMIQDTTPIQKPGVIHITSAAEYDKIRASKDGLVVVDFSAEWCGPCKKIAPFYEQLAASTPSVTFLHLDVDKVTTNDSAGVSSIPTFKFFKKKSLVHEFSGADQQELQDSVSKHKTTGAQEGEEMGRLPVSLVAMSITDLATLKAPLVNSENAGLQNVAAFCKFIRDSSIRTEQDLVSGHGLRLLRAAPGSLGNDIYALAEQVLIACLDTHKFYDAEFCLKYLEKQFGEKSNRVLRLRGMLLEFQGQATADKDCLLAATVVYQSILEKDPTDMLTLKRQISIAKTQGLRDQTIRLLTEYLHLFGSDFEAWLELASIYLENCMYTSAVFCFEELITLQPQNYHLYVRYGEVLSTIGGLDNLITARKQFTFSLELSKVNNLRAWWGIVSTTQGITSAKGVSPKNSCISVNLYDLAVTEISKASKGTRNLPYITSALSALAPSAAARSAAESHVLASREIAVDGPAAIASPTPAPAATTSTAPVVPAGAHPRPNKKK